MGKVIKKADVDKADEVESKDEADEVDESADKKVEATKAKGKSESDDSDQAEKNSEAYYRRKYEKAQAALAAEQEKSKKLDTELRDERKKLQSREEVETYNNVLDQLEDAGLPIKMRHLIDLSWDQERIDKAIDTMKEQFSDRRKESDETTKDRHSDDDKDGDGETTRKLTTQRGDVRPAKKREQQGLKDLSHLPPDKALVEAYNDL